jgi:flagellar basal-body rod protein FlgF
METATYVALSSQQVLQRQMDLLANNIANQSTTAFKGERMIFAQYLTTEPDGNPVSYVQDIGTLRDLSEGPLTTTGNPLDIALNGPGYFAVSTPSGIRYTRAGHLQLDAQGELVTMNGYQVQGATGQPIVLPQGAAGFTIGPDGTVATQQQGVQTNVGQIPVVDFAQPQALLAQAQGLYSTNQAPQPALNTTVLQKTTEGSNVQPILAMTQLLGASRSVGSSKNFVDAENTREKNAIDRLGKTV